ncbi:MAG TPA: AMIN domain-containing protein [Gemmatimonadaceae bacterium]|nr:AMIN domain-containing protein [Gemmatimonadaceae bacterium]
MRRVWTLVGVAVIALTARAAVVRAATTDEPGTAQIQSLRVIRAAGHAELVIAVSGAVNVEDFTLGQPPRLVLDLDGARLATPARMYDRVPRGGITNVRIAQYRQDTVRVVVDLDSTRAYTINRVNGAIHVSIAGPAGQFAAWNAGPGVVEGVSDGDAPSLVAKDGAHPHVFAPRAPLRRITVTYQDADINDVIAGFAAFSGRTIVVGSSVKGTVSAEIHDQPWDVALQAILQSQGLAAKEDAHGIITVDSYANISAQQAAAPLTTQIIPVNYARAASLIPTVTSLLTKQCAPGKSGAQANCLVRGSVSADTATNRLIVTDVAARLKDISNYVQDLDVRTPQVAIKAKIVLVNRTNTQNLGLSYDLGQSNQFFNKLVQRPDPATFKPIDTNGDGVNDAVSGTPYNTNQNIIALGGDALSAIANANQRVVDPALSLIFSTVLGKFDLTAFLDALQEVDLADVQAEPSVTTLDNREATLVSGEDTPIRVIDIGSLSQGGNGTTAPRANVTFKQTGIILKVTPHVTNNRQVLMTLHAERSSLQPAASDLGYTFLEQKADNQILVGDGETAVIGGLTVTQVQTTKTGIPLLVDLPLVGRLFGTTVTKEVKDDLLILVTPHIIDGGEELGPPGGSPSGR